MLVTESPFSKLPERKVVWLLSSLAAIHVFLFSAVFPLDNAVEDEQAHLDLVVKYSRGRIPRGLEPYAPETLQYLAVFASQEFLFPPTLYADGKFPPPLWTQPPETATPILRAREAQWQGINYESSQPPLFYALAAGWWHLGKTCGMDGGRLLYWLRFLNVLFVAALVWLGYAAARLVFPENIFPRLGVPAVAAFLPQPVFYSVSNDPLAAVAFAAAFVCLLQFWRAEIPHAGLGAVAGLALSAAFLAKLSNLPLLAVSGVFIAWKIFRLAREKNLRAAAPATFALAAGAALPALCWMAWCKIHFGDFTGSKIKLEYCNWTLKPFAEWFHHPLFTPRGGWIFLAGNLGTFWQGEFLWHGRPLTWPPADALYTLAALVLPALAAAKLFQRSAGLTSAQRAALGFALAAFVAELAFFAFLSVIYDFHDSTYPSRAHPYFISGRLMLGALLPFLLLFICGLDRALGRFGSRTKFIALAAMISAMLILEVLTDWPAFSSQYNWFHV